jgi:hypothetical protein
MRHNNCKLILHFLVSLDKNIQKSPISKAIIFFGAIYALIYLSATFKSLIGKKYNEKTDYI